ncbi:E3 SUMO-protein ligase ZBED1-like [Ischnura elegans]|uniref:E3 SUMO-protein ligase ZBED1-like n=1 Tax=Ischnura elegans TaxID=197161 RepID=UPI001ED876EA|nr:E3 SUMO-protein ligase ZBED1-like [Ischnura elegans]
MEPTDGSMAFASHGEWEKANKSNYLWEHFIKVEPGTRERGPKASELWEHFIKVNSEAQCKYCSKMCKRTKGNTSTMRAHLRTKHPYEYAYYLRESRGRNNIEYSEVNAEKEQYGEKEIEDAGVSTELQQSPSPEQSAASTSYIAPEEAPPHEEEQLAPARHGGKYQQSEPQPTMHNFLNLKEESFERCSRSVAYFIATEAMPTSIVDSGGFRAMLEVLRPGFGSSCPSRHAMMETYIPRLYNDTQKTVEDILRTAEWYAVTCDSWTSETKLPYLAVTVNFITKEWTLENLCLESFVQDDSHSGRHLCEAIKVVLQDWGVSPSFFSAITTDNGISVTSAARMMDVPHISCFAHSLQIAVEKVFNDDDVREVITKVQQMQALFSASYNLRRDLLLEAEKQGKRGRLLPSVSPTQWWSTLHLIQAVVEQDVLLHAVLTREEYVKKNYCQLLLSSREVNLLIAVLSVLNPLEDICEHMSGMNHCMLRQKPPLVSYLAM